MKKVREGYKITELGEIPEEWEVSKLGNLSEIVRGASPRPKGDPKYYGGSVPRLMISDVTRDGKYVTPKTDFLTEEGAKKSRPMKKGDLVISVSGTVALPTFLAVDSCIHDGFMGFKYIDGKLLKDYLYYEILNLREKLKNSATDGGVYINLTTDIVKNFDVLVPPTNEQQKIASILSSVDEQIEKTDNLIEKTKELKKGLMEQLLTRGIGHSRFKDTDIGRIPEEWGVKKLEEICEFWDGKRKPIKAEERSKMSGSIPYYGASGIIDWVNDFIFDDELILLGEDGENIKSRNVPLAFKVIGKCWVNNHAHVLKVREDNNTDFITYVLEDKDYSSYVIGSAQPKLNQAQCRKFIIQIPPAEEQEKIALILSSVDEQIQQYEFKKEKLQELKKGLMQNLLTGKIRVKV
ncbi:restriction endonuclease subunit S [Clostridium folliculivorans]|uniref:restriction endonuclease subunit S n=1 Tax=Clostridium folliculivorans TaxID=2886038 RepID=UPI0021C25705|nr:restriction endonuclease subunit S [Clostridium folliculivorans]GKU29304.1 type I restriction modification system subunit S [Clostridium folliculivorans]